MLASATYMTLNAATVFAGRSSAHRFNGALPDPETAQRSILLELLGRNQACAYGKRYGFGAIRSIEDYQARVPIVTYDDLVPWIEHMKLGEKGILTSDPVLMFEKSSGSTTAAKFIPYTPTLKAHFQAALAPWITDLYRSFPGLRSGPAYWLVTPIARKKEHTQGGIPIGFENDAEYFGTLQRWVIEKTMAVPAALANVLHLGDCIYLTLRFLLQARSLTFISVWNPSFLHVLLRHLELNGEHLVRDLGVGSATVSTRLPSAVSRALRRDAIQSQKLQSMLRQGRIEPTVLWPKLNLISCWTSASSALLKAELEQKFSGVAIQGKGLLATEGVISIPIERYGGCVAALTSHFLEFMDPQSGRCRSLSEVEQGSEYSVILTTAGGLWRYQLGDRVRVTGFAERTPILEFVGKEDCVSDLRGEKLNAIFVQRALEEIECCRNAVFAMLAPSQGPSGYTLFLQSRHCTSGLAALVDARLRENPHYDYARNLKQLAPVRVFHIAQGGREGYILRCESLGQRAGSVKTTALDKRTGWEEVFRGNYVGVEPVEVTA
jgi:hypothetical protein